MCNVYPIFWISLTSEVLPPNLQLYTSSFVFTCRFYKVFGRYLLCCVRIGLDWIQILGHQLDWTGLGSVARGFHWTGSFQLNPFHTLLHRPAQLPKVFFFFTTLDFYLSASLHVALLKTCFGHLAN